MIHKKIFKFMNLNRKINFKINRLKFQKNKKYILTSKNNCYQLIKTHKVFLKVKIKIKKVNIYLSLTIKHHPQLKYKVITE